MQTIQPNSSAPANKDMTSQTFSTTHLTDSTSNVKQASDQSSKETDCLINLKDKKEMALWLMITLLLLICFLLLVIIVCLTCKCFRGIRNDKLVVTKSSKITRRNSLNGGPSETDIMLKDCSSVKVEIETTTDESQEPEEVGGATAEVGNQVSTKENKNSPNVTSETTPTQEFDQSGETDLKKEDLEKEE